MLNRSILREERSVLLEVLRKHQRVDVLGVKGLSRTGVWWGGGGSEEGWVQ